ncbi:TrmH family RNA methyltransferase [Candidatus Shapirobacteria bacterium]|nr:TrmH family RNA methyltransferase [Candidatus Shapirobacteria bacterium]
MTKVKATTPCRESKEHVGEPVISLLLVDLGSPHNIGQIIRTSYILGGEKVRLYIFDPRGRLDHNREEVGLTSVELVGEEGAYTRVDDLEEFLAGYPGRIIATDITEQAESLVGFQFRRGDLILVGNENRGYRDEPNLREHPGLEHVAERLIVPMGGKAYGLPDRGSIVPEDHGLYPNLNVAATVAIVTYVALAQLGYFNEFGLKDLRRNAS